LPAPRREVAAAARRMSPANRLQFETFGRQDRSSGK
jgi:hypothetical protein